MTTIAAVRRGALTLAVGNIIGGNTFDVMFVAAADIAYRDGSLYHSMSQSEQFLLTLTITMTGVLILGLVCREKFGVAKVGFESVLILGLYGFAVAVMLAGL